MIIVWTIEIIVTITLTNPIQILITMLGYYNSVDSFNEKSKFVGSFNIEILIQTVNSFILYTLACFISKSRRNHLETGPLCAGGVCRKYINQSWIIFKCLPITELSKFNKTHIVKSCIFVNYVYQLWRLNIFQIRSLWHLSSPGETKSHTHILIRLISQQVYTSATDVSPGQVVVSMGSRRIPKDILFCRMFKLKN